MTKNLIAFAAGMAILSGCQKVDLSEYLDKEETGYAVTFNLGNYVITDFEESKPAANETTGMRKAKKLASELGSVVNLAVFRGEEKVKTVNQKASDAGFGTVKMLLPAGDYRIVALVHRCQGNATITSADKISFPGNKVTDTFCYSETVSVNGDKSVDAELSRCVAKFRFVIEDAIPADVAKIQFYYTGGSSTLNAVTGYGCVNSRQTEQREVNGHSAGQVFEVYTFPHAEEDELKMTVTALDSGGGEYAVRMLEAVPVVRQKVTNCSMSLFGGNTASQNVAFALTGDDQWKGEIEYHQ